MSELTATTNAIETASDPAGSTAEPAGSAGAGEPNDAGHPCAACPHPWPAHDALGMRFCTATLASSSARGCICR